MTRAEYTQHLIAACKKQGLKIEVRPPMDVCVATVKRRIYDTPAKRKARDEARKRYEAKRKVYIPPVKHKYVPQPTKIHSPA